MNAARPAYPSGAMGDGGERGPRDVAAVENASGKDLDALIDPAVRDLAWLLLSADLLRAQPPLAPLARWWSDEGQIHAVRDWLAQLDRNPARLHEALAAAPTNRLGRYAEVLLGWFLANGPAARLVAQNVALRRAGLTLGECDFLVQTSLGERLHWELAVKCYLHAGESEGEPNVLARFVGPNLRDRFDLKLTHLRDHQLRLSTREEFASLGYDGPWLAQMFVKGWLFYRAGEAGASRPEDPPELAADHGRGWWVTRSAWPEFARQQAADGWSVLPRLAWLAPRRLLAGDVTDAGDSEPRADFVVSTTIARPTHPEALLAALTRPHDPVLVAAFASDGAGGYREQSRGFIVPDDWPERAAAFASQEAR
jgi:uncharacterized protein